MNYHYKAPAIQKATRVIEHLAAANTPVRLTPLAQALDLSKSSLHGILHSLVEAGWLKKYKKSGFQINPEIFKLILSHRQEPDLLQVSRPFMEYLAEQTTESIFLGQRNQSKVLILDCVLSPKEMGISARSGTKIPLFAGAIGKIFLSEYTEVEIRSFLAETPLPVFTENSISDTERFLSVVDEVKKKGFALDDEEYLPGVKAVAVPIRQAGRLVAGLWIAGFSSQFTNKILIRARERLVDAGKIISNILDQASTPNS